MGSDRASVRVDVHADAGVTTITIAGGTGNPIDAALAVRLRAAMHQVQPECRVVHLRAAGANFSVGGDVRAFASENPAQVVDEIVSAFHDAIVAFVRLPMPTVCSVRGWAAGGAFGLATAADIVIAGRGAIFKPAHVTLGLTSDGGTAWQLVRAVGRARAADILLTGGELSAAEALSAGLVSRVVEDDRLDSETHAVLDALIAGPPAAQREIKRLVDATGERGLIASLDDERASMLRSSSGPEFREGVAAFLEKRSPVFDPHPTAGRHVSAGAVIAGVVEVTSEGRWEEFPA